MEDDFFPDFLEFEETESNDKVSSPKKEKKASSNSTKKEKALNTKDDDFELFSNEESIVEAEVVETTSAIDSAIEEESTIESAQDSSNTEEVEEETTVDNLSTNNQEELDSTKINTQNTIEKDEETNMAIVPPTPENTTPTQNNEPQMELSFEAALTQLELIVNQMETGNFKLEELLAAYEKGNSLAKICKDKLEKMERKVELLTKDNGTNGEWTPFDASNHR
jgi:exodeoxyribonuclease VII small subunit